MGKNTNIEWCHHTWNPWVYNAFKIQEALDCKPALQALLASSNIDQVSMAQEYLDHILKIEDITSVATSPQKYGTMPMLKPFTAAPKAAATVPVAAIPTGGMKISIEPLRWDESEIIDGHAKTLKTGYAHDASGGGGYKVMIDFGDTQVRYIPPEGNNSQFWAITKTLDVASNGEVTAERMQKKKNGMRWYIVWSWTDRKIDDLRPRVDVNSVQVVVTYHARSDLGCQHITRFEETFKSDSYLSTSTQTEVARGGGGYVF